MARLSRARRGELARASEFNEVADASELVMSMEAKEDIPANRFVYAERDDTNIDGVAITGTGTYTVEDMFSSGDLDDVYRIANTYTLETTSNNRSYAFTLTFSDGFTKTRSSSNFDTSNSPFTSNVFEDSRYLGHIVSVEITQIDAGVSITFQGIPNRKRIRLARADDVEKSDPIGFITEAVNSGSSVDVFPGGFLEIGSGYKAGEILYLGDNGTLSRIPGTFEKQLGVVMDRTNGGKVLKIRFREGELRYKSVGSYGSFTENVNTIIMFNDVGGSNVNRFTRVFYRTEEPYFFEDSITRDSNDRITNTAHVNWRTNQAFFLSQQTNRIIIGLT